ncbi:MAG: hypothetical protein ACRD1U_19195, partial [Vicinamibacterales bacterium]
TVLGVVEISLPRGIERAPDPPPDTAAPFERGQEVIRELARRRPRKPAAASRATPVSSHNANAKAAHVESSRVNAKAKARVGNGRVASAFRRKSAGAAGSSRGAAAAAPKRALRSIAARKRTPAKSSRGNR